MLPNRITVKLFLDEAEDRDLAAFIPVFHRWIREHALPGTLIDVADYKHLHQGPGVLLIGHEGDYAIDLVGGRTGLLYRGKRAWSDATLPGRLRAVFQAALHAARLLETEPSLAGQIAFRANEVELTLPDQLNTPNEPATFDAIRADVQAAAEELFAGSPVSLRYQAPDPRRPLAIGIQSSGRITHHASH